jgi:hypothetical protein
VAVLDHDAVFRIDAGGVGPRARKPVAVVGFTTAHGRIVAIDLIADPEKLRELPVGL